MKKLISVILTAAMLASFVCIAVSAGNETSYTIDNPYEEAFEKGWEQYKTNLHTHSYVSDATTDYRDMILEYYRQGYDVLAMTDHGATDRGWNNHPAVIPLYMYQMIIGNITHYFTDEEYNALQNGTFEIDNSKRSDGQGGMTCVKGGNELNALTITKCHVNAFFPDVNDGNNHMGYEYDYEGAVAYAQEHGAICFMNHPGDMLGTNDNPDAVNDEENISYFGEILLNYDNCLGMEVFNEKNSVTGYDRILWDNVLMYCLPYGRNVIAFSNSDAHEYYHIDTSFSLFMMEENTEANVKETMESGAFFCVTRMLRKNDKLGPTSEQLKNDNNTNDNGYNDLNANIYDENTTEDLAYPVFTDIKVNNDTHEVTVKVKNCYNIQWVANGNVIATKDIDPKNEFTGETEYTIDLDNIEGNEDFLYIRCQLLGSGGCTLTQTFVIDDGTEETYVKDESAAAKWDSFVFRLKSLRIVVIFKTVIDAIFG